MASKDVRLMYSLLRCGHGPSVVPGEIAGELNQQTVAVLRRAFSDSVDGERLSTALAFAIADITGPGSRALARSLGKEESEGERLSMIGREAVCNFLLSLLRGREKLREEHRKEVDRLFLESIYTLIKIYKQTGQQLSLATLIMTGNPRLYEVSDDSVREFARELASLLKAEAAHRAEQKDEGAEVREQEVEPQVEPVRQARELEVMKKLRRLKIAAMKARSALESV